MTFLEWCRALVLGKKTGRRCVDCRHEIRGWVNWNGVEALCDACNEARVERLGQNP